MLRPGEPVRRNSASGPQGNMPSAALLALKHATHTEGTTVRGAKKGGLTDHIAGPHLIPNVGREAMVPAECVRRQRPVPKIREHAKAKPEPKKQTAVVPTKPRTSHRRRSPGREGRKDDSSSESESRPRRRSQSPDKEKSARAPAAETRDRGRRQLKREEEAEATEAERLEQEQAMLAELEEARKKKLEIEAKRKKNLGGAFAMTEDDMNADDDDKAQKARAAKEMARAEQKRVERDRNRENAFEALVSPTSSSSTTTALPRVINKEMATAADLDGSMHDHKFSKVWKDWDAQKKDDPGAIAMQFMKISAIKRRGYAPIPKRSRSRSRSPPKRR